MTQYGSQKASVIASVTAAMLAEKMAKLDELSRAIIASQVGILLGQGYDLGEIRYAAVEIALAGGSTWLLADRVRAEFRPVSVPRATTGEVATMHSYLTAVPFQKVNGETHGRHLTKTDSAAGGSATQEAGGDGSR